MDYYTALNILLLRPGFTEEELRNSYRKLSKRKHPDTGGSEEEFKELQLAKKKLEESLNSNNSRGWTAGDFSGFKITINTELILKYTELKTGCNKTIYINDTPIHITVPKWCIPGRQLTYDTGKNFVNVVIKGEESDHIYINWSKCEIVVKYPITAIDAIIGINRSFKLLGDVIDVNTTENDISDIVIPNKGWYNPISGRFGDLRIKLDVSKQHQLNTDQIDEIRSIVNKT